MRVESHFADSAPFAFRLNVPRVLLTRLEGVTLLCKTLNLITQTVDSRVHFIDSVLYLIAVLIHVSMLLFPSWRPI